MKQARSSDELFGRIKWILFNCSICTRVRFPILPRGSHLPVYAPKSVFQVFQRYRLEVIAKFQFSYFRPLVLRCDSPASLITRSSSCQRYTYKPQV